MFVDDAKEVLVDLFQAIALLRVERHPQELTRKRHLKQRNCLGGCAGAELR